MKWEYKVIEINSIKNLGNPINLQNELNNYDEEGWEPIGILKKPHEGVGWTVSPDEGSVIFKRSLAIG